MFYLFIRLELTHDFLLGLMGQVSDRSRENIEKGEEWEWRYKKLNEVSFERVLFSFKPLKAESYWDDLSFLK